MDAKLKLVDLFERLLPRTAVRRRVASRSGPNSRSDLTTLRKYLGEGGHGQHAAIDVGANSGLFTWPLAQLFGQVLAIEPNIERARFLERSLPANVSVLCAACSDVYGVARLSAPRAANGVVLHGLGKLAANPAVGFHRVVSHGVKSWHAPLVRIDDAVAQIKLPVSFIKIDVEGHELAALSGAAELLNVQRPVVFAEIEQEHGGDTVRIYDLMASHRYVCFAVDRGTLDRCDTIERFNEALSRPRVVNFLFEPT